MYTQAFIQNQFRNHVKKLHRHQNSTEHTHFLILIIVMNKHYQKLLILCLKELHRGCWQGCWMKRKIWFSNYLTLSVSMSRLILNFFVARRYHALFYFWGVFSIFINFRFVCYLLTLCTCPTILKYTLNVKNFSKILKDLVVQTPLQEGYHTGRLFLETFCLNTCPLH